MTRRRKILLACFSIPFVLLLLVLLALLGLLTTKPGLQTLVTVANKFGGDTLSIGTGQGALTSDFTLRNLRFAGAGTEVLLEEIRLAWDPKELVNKELPVKTLQVKGLKLLLPEATEKEASTEPVQMPEIRLPVAVRAEEVELERLEIFSGTKPLFDLKRAHLHKLDAAEARLTFEELAAKNGWMDAKAQGEVHMLGNWPLKLGLNYDVDLKNFGVKDVGPVRGKLDAQGNLEDLGLKVDLKSPLALTLEAKLKELLNKLQWQVNLKIPKLEAAKFGKDLPEVVLDALQVQGKGDLQNYGAKVSVRLDSAPGMVRRPLDLQTEVQATASDAVIKSLRIADGPGHLDLAGKVAWSPAIAWDVNLGLHELRPDIAVADLPGTVDGKLAVKGGLNKGQPEVTAQIDNLNGKLRGYPLSVNGQASYQNGKVTVQDLRAAMGRTRLTANGSYAETCDLNLNLDAPDLHELLPELEGRLAGKILVTGSQKTPALDVDLTGSSLNFSGNKVKNLKVQAKGMVSTKENLQAQIQAAGIQAGGQSIDKVDLRLQGRMDQHTLTLRTDGLTTKEGRVGLELAGKLDGSAWSGELRRLMVQLPQIGAWQQSAQAAGLAASAKDAGLAPLCLQSTAGPYRGVKLCLDGGWRGQDGHWRGKVSVDGLELVQLKQYLPPDFELSGRLSLNAEAEGKGGDLQEAHVQYSIPGQRLHFVSGAASTTEDLVWKNHQLAASYVGSKLNLNWVNELADGSSLVARIASPNLPLAGDAILKAPLQGEVALDFRKLDILTALSQHRSLWKGALQGKFQLAGLIGKPLVSGNLGLEKGEALIPELALKLTPIKIDLGGDAGKLTATVEAHAEEGQLRITGGVDMSGDKLRILPVTVKGENFRAMNQPGLLVEISPDIRVDITDQRIDVSGKLLVPRTNVKNVDVNSAISPSGDVVVVDDPKEKESGPGVPLYLNLDVGLGEKVIINAFGLYAKLSGNLKLQQSPGHPISGNGQVMIDKGSFSVFGKKVKITFGRLMFSGGSLTNPGVDIKSENKEDNITARLRVSGFLQQPHLELSSKPHLEQLEIVNHLLDDTTNLGGEGQEDLGLVGDTAEKLGMGGMVPYLEGIKRLSMIDDIKLDKKGDDSSLVLGTWLTPNFYVSYSKSLSGEGSVFKTRYTLGKGFVVETESGETENSGDIRYEFEY